MADTPDKPAKNPGDVYTVEELLRFRADSDADWIVNNLIRKGDQVLLVGPPKSGKSLLAMQLGLMVALGGKVHEKVNQKNPPFMFAEDAESNLIEPRTQKLLATPIQVKCKRKVLYISLEMGGRSVGDRLRHQLSGFGYRMPAAEGESPVPAVTDIDLKHVFEFPAKKTDGPQLSSPRRSLRLVEYRKSKDGEGAGRGSLETTQDFEDLRKLIQDENPELVIIDTMIQLHQLDENSNIEMKALMGTIRSACVQSAAKGGQPIAHVILHHKRKETAQGGYQSGADAMRGAGSIHSEADLALTMRYAGASESDLILETSARDIAVDDRFLKFHPDYRLFNSELKKAGDQMEWTLVVAEVLAAMLASSEFREPPAVPDPANPAPQTPVGFRAEDVRSWMNQNGPGIALAAKFSKPFVVTETLSKDLLDRMGKRNLVALVPTKSGKPGGRGNKATFLVDLNKAAPSKDEIATAIGQLQYQSQKTQTRRPAK